MRAHLAIALLLVTAAWSVDSSRRSGPALDLGERHELTQREVAHAAGFHVAAIRACYAEQANGVRAATGQLQLDATVLRTGWAIGVTIEAPGIAGTRLRALEACVRDEVATWRFPLNDTDTQIVIPYLFLRVPTPGAGPQYTCWDPSGCRGGAIDKHGHR